jgi:hypothetical protein
MTVVALAWDIVMAMGGDKKNGRIYLHQRQMPWSHVTSSEADLSNDVL